MFLLAGDFARASQKAEVHYVLETTSTQDTLRSLPGAAPLTTIVAGVQTQGRGRLGRSWHSEAGQSLLASTLVVLPDTPVLRDTLGFLTLIAAAAMRSALAITTGGQFQVKFPNDIVTPNGLKIAGVLGEFFADTSKRRGELCLALGVGVNVYQQGKALFPGSTSLASAGVLNNDEETAVVDQLLSAYLDQLRERITTFAADPDQPNTTDLITELNAHLAGRGYETTVAGQTGVIQVLSPRAELIVRTPHGDVAIAPSEVAMIAEFGQIKPDADLQTATVRERKSHEDTHR
ncbi:biotin--[acetyl-CoA-carboxylase] ligase [Trueperella pecoris]|uniref:biotin--[acetyl-CoA-carboxylase] ligase n=1 Tax=Trueperella pecoris TaxID=2733571 RepID=UPI001ABDC1D5|nr:hypothetical protein [Trueperella pecoris]QTG74937.1 hypothetical protein J4179_06820 [Trueperella pecoris]